MKFYKRSSEKWDCQQYLSWWQNQVYFSYVYSYTVNILTSFVKMSQSQPVNLKHSTEPICTICALKSRRGHANGHSYYNVISRESIEITPEIQSYLTAA